MVDALLGHAGRHGAAHHVAGRQLVDEALAVTVAQERAVAAQRLGEQRAGHGRVVQRRGVELHELHVGRRDTGPQRHGHAVAGGLRRVGGDREELAGATGGQHDMVGPHLDGTAAAAGRQGPHAHAAAALDQEIEGEPAFEHGAGRAVGGVDEGALDLRAGGGATGVHDARPGVASLARQRQQAGGLAVELDPEGDQLVHAARPLVDEDAHGLLVAQSGAGRQRVGQVQVGRVLVGAEHRGDAALRPARGRLREHALGQHAEGERRRGPARAGQPHRGRQSGDAASEDQDVEGSGPGPGGHAGSVSVSSASRWADTSSITRLRPSTWTTRGTYASSSARS